MENDEACEVQLFGILSNLETLSTVGESLDSKDGISIITSKILKMDELEDSSDEALSLLFYFLRLNLLSSLFIRQFPFIVHLIVIVFPH